MTSPIGEGRLRILRAARDLFQERGYADVSMQEIADTVGITKSTLYHHFRDKEDLFVEVVRWVHGSFAREMRETIAGAATLEEQLERLVVAFWASGKADFGRLMQDLHQHVSQERHDRLHEELHRADVDSPEGVVRELFAQAVERGEIIQIDPDIPFAMVFGLFIALKHFAERPEAQGKITDEVALMIPRILLHGLAAKSGQ